MRVRISVLVLCIAMVASMGCSSSPRADMQQEGYKSAVRAESEKDEGILSALAFWTWFEKDQDEQLEAELEQEYMPQTLREDRKKDEGILDVLAFWTWFEEEEPVDYTIQPLQHELDAEKEKGLLDQMAFWTWFEPKDDSEITAKKVRADMSPALTNFATDDQESQNRRARTIDHNTRQIWDDIEMILLLERPVRMTKYPLP